MNEPPGARNRVLTATGAVGRSVQAGDPRNTGGQPVCRATSEFWSYDSAGEYAGWPRVRRLAPSPPAGPESAGWPRVRRPPRLAIRGDRARPGDHRRVSPPVAVVPRRRSRVRLGAGSKGVRAAARARPSRLAIRGDRARPGDHRRVSPLPASRRGDDHRTPGPTIEQPGPRQGIGGTAAGSRTPVTRPARPSPTAPTFPATRPPRQPAREPGR